MDQVLSKRKPLIFIVDDEPMILETFSTLLEDDYRVQTFNGPKEFLDFIDQPSAKKPDLLISDLMMPGISGTEMISQAMEKGMDFPSILLSGNLDKDTVIQAVNLGVYKVFEKPIHTDILMGAIDQLLIEYEIARAREEIRQVTGQLREIYSSFRLVIDAHLSEEVKSELQNLVGAENVKESSLAEPTSMEELMDRLETRLENLLNQELVLQNMRHSPARSTV